jgi:hypothetical protein
VFRAIDHPHRGLPLVRGPPRSCAIFVVQILPCLMKARSPFSTDVSRLRHDLWTRLFPTWTTSIVPLSRSSPNRQQPTSEPRYVRFFGLLEYPTSLDGSLPRPCHPKRARVWPRDWGGSVLSQRSSSPTVGIAHNHVMWIRAP